jgi:DNA-binding MarR family transcriptional regulator
MTSPDPVGAAPASAAPTDPRQVAVRDLEGAFSELMTEFRRVHAQAAESVSPGMLPGTFKVMTMIQKTGSSTVSGIAERMTADKGHISRAVSELEDLGLVERAVDAHDGRIKLISLTEEGRRRLTDARAPYVGRLASVLGDWPLESIDQLTGLLQALARGETPAE